MMLVYYLPALYSRIICFIDPLEMIKDTVERRTRLLWPGEEEEEDVTPQLILATHYQMRTDTTQTHQVSSEDLTYTNLRVREDIWSHTKELESLPPYQPYAEGGGERGSRVGGAGGA